MAANIGLLLGGGVGLVALLAGARSSMYTGGCERLLGRRVGVVVPFRHIYNVHACSRWWSQSCAVQQNFWHSEKYICGRLAFQVRF